MYIYEVQRWRCDQGSIVLEDRGFTISQGLGKQWCQDDAGDRKLNWMDGARSMQPERVEKMGILADSSVRTVQSSSNEPMYVVHRHEVLYVAPG